MVLGTMRIPIRNLASALRRLIQEPGIRRTDSCQADRGLMGKEALPKMLIQLCGMLAPM